MSVDARPPKDCILEKVSLIYYFFYRGGNTEGNAQRKMQESFSGPCEHEKKVLDTPSPFSCNLPPVPLR